MIKKKYYKLKTFLVLGILIFIGSNINYFNKHLNHYSNDSKIEKNPYISRSILQDGFYYEWYAIVNGNPFAFYTGQENYTFIGNNTYRCNETLTYQYDPPNYDQRDVNNETRYYPSSGYWGNNAHDWVWIFKNTTINMKNIPIPVFPGLEPEHLFNVTGESTINLGGAYYDVWVLEDNQSSIANYEKNTGILISGLFYFSGTNTWEINMTDTNAGIPSNDNSPALNNPNVSPAYGNLTTSFNFTVNYSDADNNAPIDINVIINNTEYSMSKQNPLDTNYVDGVMYEYQTFLKNSTYNYYFNASDGPYTISTSTYSGPTVYYNNSFSPTLSNPLVSPQLGFNSSTEFLFRVNYSDSDNNAPKFINITINGTSFSMLKENSSDLNYMDGTAYNFSIILNDIGNYVYNFTASDAENIVFLPTSGFYHNPNITRHDLNDIEIGWIISHGEQSNSTYSTFLTDAVSLGATYDVINQQIVPLLIYPYEMLIIEEGGSSWSESELKNMQYWIENGGSLMIIGDNRDQAQTSVSNAFNVSYSSQGGNSGSTYQIFQPHYLTINVNSLEFGSPFASINLSNSDSTLQVIANTSNSFPHVALLELGAGKVLWIVDEILENNYISDGDNREFGLNALRWMSESKINENIPSISDPSFSPSTGNSTSLFTFTVNYTDIDNRGPIYINISLNQQSYQMVKQDSGDYNYADGVIFQFTTTLQNGTHDYYFNASDGENNINSSIFAGPVVSYVNDFDPTLSSGVVNPNSGYEHKIFTFQVNYSDQDNNAPKYVNVTIDNNAFQMSKQDPTDNYYIDGVIYEYKTQLSVGAHDYYFNASDEERSTSTVIGFGPYVIQAPLEDIKIAWMMTHGEDSNSSYTDILNNAIDMGASIYTFQSEINDTSLLSFDIIVISEGGSSWSASELNSLENWIINGNSLLILGDNRDSSQVSASSRFDVYYSSQSGASGNYTDIRHPHDVTENTSKIYFPNPISSISSSSNIYLTPLVKDASERITIASLQYGSGKLLWVTDECFTNYDLDEVDNSLLSNNTWIWLANTSSNDNAPIINDVEINPPTGNSRTIFNFYLNYSDSDGSAPIFITLTINNTVYQMEKYNMSDYNYIIGTMYNYSIQLSPGSYQYYFNVSDGKFNASYPIGQLQLTVTPVNLEAPSFTSTSVDPYLGFGDPSLITFQVNYRDLDNSPPSYVRVYIDGISYDMTKLDPSDSSYHDGVIYQLEKNLSIGEHYYSFQAFDGVYTISDPSSRTSLGPIIIENKPLNSTKIGWVDAHGEDDYLGYTIYLNDAVALGATFEYVSSTIDSSILSNYDIIIVEEGGSSWTEGELNALASWVFSGGALFIIGDDRDNAMVSVSNKFNVYYKAYSDSIDYTSDFSQPHVLTNGLTQLYTYPYAAIDESSSTTSLQKLVRDKNGELIVATLIHGIGKITWICDDDLVRNAYIDDADNRLFANNTWLWAMEPVESPGSPTNGGDNGFIVILVISLAIIGPSTVAIGIYLIRRKTLRDTQ